MTRSGDNAVLLATGKKGLARGRGVMVELLVFTACVSYLLLIMQQILFRSTATFAHDFLFWTLPVFSYLADGLNNGVIPLWNPYTHGGEPVVPLYFQMRVLDPISIVVAVVGQLITSDLVTLAAWDRLIKVVVAATGSYLLLRQYSEFLIVRVAIIPVLLWSCFALNSFWQPGILDQYCYAPFLLYFFLNLLWKRDYRWHNWIGGALAFGLQQQSYFFVGPLLALTIIFIGFGIYHRDDLKSFFKESTNWGRAAVAMLFVAGMAMPQVSVYLDRDRFDYPARMEADYDASHIVSSMSPEEYKGAEHTLTMPYEHIHASGSFAQPQDATGLVVPPIFSRFRTSESRLYLGGLILIGALYGLFNAAHVLKRIWLLMGSIVGLLMLGPMGGLHWVLYYLYPPLRFIRHTEQLANYFLLAILFLFVIGADHWIRKVTASNFRPKLSNRTGILRYLFGDADRARLIGIVVVSSIFLAIFPYILPWDPFRPAAFGPASLTLLIGISVILVLYRDIGPLRFSIVLVLGLLSLTSILSLDRFDSVLLYAAVFVLLPLLIVLRLQQRNTKWISDSTPVFPGVRLVGAVLLLAAFVGQYSLWAVLGTAMSAILAHLVFSVLGVFAFLAMLEPDWLLRLATSSGWRITALRLTAAAMGVVLLVAFRPMIHSAQIDPLYFMFVSDRTFLLFFWSWLIVACGSIASRPEILGDTLRAGAKWMPAFRHVLNGVLVWFLFPTIFVVAYALKWNDVELRADGIWVSCFYLTALTLRGGVLWKEAASQRRFNVRRKPSKAVLSTQFFSTKHKPIALLLIFLIVDLVTVTLLYKSDWSKPRPDTVYDVRVRSEPPTLSATRHPVRDIDFAGLNYINETGQVIRYLDVFTRYATALDFPIGDIPTAWVLPGASLDGVTNSEKAGGLFQLRTYSDLISSDLHSDLLAEMFAINKPLVQFRRCAVGKDEFIELSLKSPERAQAVLNRSVVLELGSLVGGSCAGTDGHTEKFVYRVLFYNYNSLKLEITAPFDGYLYYADGYDPYWRAQVDGVATSIVRANFNFKAIPVKQGRHVVEFHYTPSVLYWSIVSFFLFLGAGLVIGAASYVRKFLPHERIFSKA